MLAADLGDLERPRGGGRGLAGDDDAGDVRLQEGLDLPEAGSVPSRTTEDDVDRGHFFVDDDVVVVVGAWS